jgi:spore germination protein
MAAKISGRDGWISVGLSILFALIYAYFITSLMEKHPGKDFVSICVEILGKPLGILTALIYGIKILISAARELSFFSEIAKELLLPDAPLFVTSASLIALAAYAAAKGYEIRARLAEILIAAALIPLIAVFIIAAFDVDYRNLFPVLGAPPQRILEGAFRTSFAFAGLDFCLMIGPFARGVKNLRKGVLTCVAAIGILYVFVTALTLARFGEIEILTQKRPVLEMMDSVDIPGSFMERQEGLIVTFWIISTFAFVNASIFFSSLLFKDIIHPKRLSESFGDPVIKKSAHTIYIWLSAAAIFLISLFLTNIETLNKTLEVAFLLIIPLLLLIISKIKKAAVAVLCLALLTSCGVELEDRAFVISIGADWNGEYITTMEIINEGTFSAAAGELKKTLELIEDQTPKRIYFGQTKLAVIGESILNQPEAFKEILNFIETNPEISRKIIFTAAENANHVLTDENTKENSGNSNENTGIFVSRYYRLNKRSFKSTAEKVLFELRTKSQTFAPIIAKEDGKIKIGGAYDIQDYKAVGKVPK